MDSNCSTLVQKGREMEQQSMCIVEVKRASDRIKILKLVIKGLLLNVVSAYTPQVDCQNTKLYWSKLDEVEESVSRMEMVVIGL